MNTTTSPVRVRLTPAAYLLIFTLISLAVTFAAFVTNHPWIYIAGLPTTAAGILLTGDSASRSRRKS